MASSSEESENEVDAVPVASTSKERRKSYDFAFKNEVISFVRQNSIHSAERKYKVGRKTIRGWLKLADQLNEEGSKPSKRFSGAGRKLKDSEMDDQLIAWFRSERQERHKVGREDLRSKAMQLYRRNCPADTPTEEIENGFKGSNGWLHKFMNRHKLCLRRRTTQCQKEPKDLIDKIVNFLLFVRQERLAKQYPLTAIYACDETACWLDDPGSTTVSERGVREVTIRTTGHEKLNITVMLTARADGRKMKPFVILPRKRPMPDLEAKFASNIVIAYGGTRSWMNDELTKHYLYAIIGGFAFSERFLVWDSFRCHISDATKAVLPLIKVNTAVIPGGCTGKIQPADVSWNKPFKAKFRDLYNQWIRSGEVTHTAANNPRAADWYQVCSWIADAWESVSDEVVVESFKHCGITLATDGSEDSLVSCFKDDKELSAGSAVLRRKSEEQFGAAAAAVVPPPEQPEEELFSEEEIVDDDEYSQQL